MIKLFTFVLWQAFACVHGIYDGELYEVRDFKKRFLKHPHFFATIMRIMVGFGFVLIYREFPHTWETFWLFGKDLIGYGLTFSLWHNGCYFDRRRQIKTTEEGYSFFSTSTSSTSWKFKLGGKEFQPFEFTGTARVILYLIGVYLIYFNEVNSIIN